MEGFKTVPRLNEDQVCLVEKALRYAKEVQRVYASFLGSRDPKATRDSRSDPSHALMIHNLSILSRIYVGSVHFELGEPELRQIFEVFGPVRNVSLSIDPSTGHHKGFCFVEFEIPEAASMAVEEMNGKELGGRAIKVGRPNNFPPELPSGIPKPDKRRVYVSNVHECVTEQELSEVFGAFGTVSQCRLSPGSFGHHKGYGYVEYESEGPARRATRGLKGFTLGGLELKVGPAVVGGELAPGMDTGQSRKRAKLPEQAVEAVRAINQNLTSSFVERTTEF